MNIVRRSSAPTGCGAATARRCARTRATRGSRARSRTPRARPALPAPPAPRAAYARGTAEAPTTPPITNDRAPAPLPSSPVAPWSTDAYADARSCTRCGDLLLDVVVRLDSRWRGRGRDVQTTLTAGGQAANVAAWVAALGGQARFLGKRADDGAGRLARRRRARGTGSRCVGPVAATGTGVDRLARRRRTATGRCAPTAASRRSSTPDELDPGWLAGCDLRPRLRLCARPRADRASRRVAGGRSGTRAGARVSVDLSSWSVIRDVGPERFRELVIEGSRRTWSSRTRTRSEIVGGRFDGPAWILKRGAARMLDFDGDERAALPAVVVDATGAGDALAAGWLLGGPDLALEAAARCVGQPGSMPRLGSGCRGAAARADLGARSRPRSRKVAVSSRSRRPSSRTGSRRPTASRSRSRASAASARRAPCRPPSACSTARPHRSRPPPSSSASRRRRASSAPRPRRVRGRRAPSAATTVGGLSPPRARSGIRALGTGGLGGVHRGFPTPPDVSADLGALARTEAVDRLARGSSACSTCPRRWSCSRPSASRRSAVRATRCRCSTPPHGGPPVSARVDSPTEAARIARAHWELGGAGARPREPPTGEHRRRAADRRGGDRGASGGRRRAGRDPVRARRTSTSTRRERRGA